MNTQMNNRKLTLLSMNFPHIAPEKMEQLWAYGTKVVPFEHLWNILYMINQILLTTPQTPELPFNLR